MYPTDVTTPSAEHWNRVYQTKRPTEVSWYREHLETSLALVRATGGRRIIDVGGGESTLVDDLLVDPDLEVSVLDLAEAALEVTRHRLGRAAERVRWIAGDVTSVALPPAAYDVWHDRAVFHFLTDPLLRARYVAQVARSVRPGGHVIVGAFGPSGPLQCSGLDVVRYDADRLHGEFGPRFELVEHREEIHHTPAGREQQFVWCFCRVEPPAERVR